jgi:hypothetical protein
MGTGSVTLAVFDDLFGNIAAAVKCAVMTVKTDTSGSPMRKLRLRSTEGVVSGIQNGENVRLQAVSCYLKGIF